MKLFQLFCLSVLLTLTSCRDKDPEPCIQPPEDIWSMKLSSFNQYAGCALKNPDPNKNEVNVIIQTAEQFDALNTCSIQNHSINFSFYTVLAGRLKTPGGGRVLNQWVTKECNNIILHVEIGWGSGTTPGDVFYDAVIDKISDSQNVFFDIQVLNCSGSGSADPEVIPYTSFMNGSYCGLAMPVENPDVYSFKVINNQADYEKYFFCGFGDPLPTIDFNTQTIFAARVATTSLYVSVNHSVIKKCNQYLYSAELTEIISTESQTFTFYVIVPKVPEGTTVYFDFSIH